MAFLIQIHTHMFSVSSIMFDCANLQCRHPTAPPPSPHTHTFALSMLHPCCASWQTGKKPMQSVECPQAIGAQPALLSTLLHGDVMHDSSAKIFKCSAGQYAVMFPKGDQPPLDSITSLLQMLLLLLNRLQCLHSEIQSIWHGTVKNKKDLSRWVQPSDRSEAQTMLNSKSDKVKAAWDGCHGRINQLKSHIGMC